MNILIGYILTYLYLILVLKTISFFKKKYTLKDEYERDLAKGLPIEEPVNYFFDGDVNVLWRSTAMILFNNWLNYHVYQVTPYEFKEIAMKY